MRGRRAITKSVVIEALWCDGRRAVMACTHTVLIVGTRSCGVNRAGVNRQIIQIFPHGRGRGFAFWFRLRRLRLLGHD
jgi:hypothetical protein